MNSVKRFAIAVAALILLASGLVFLLDQLIAAQTQLTSLISLSQAAKTVVVVAFGLIIVLLIRHTKRLLSKYVGIHVAAVFQFFMILVVGIVMIFASLDIFQVSPTTLLARALN